MKRQSDSTTKKEKIISTIISLGIIMALVIGVYSVVTSVNKGNEENNIVNLNETQENVAMNIEDGQEDEEPVDDAEAANGEAIQQTQATTEPTTQEPTTLSVEEVAASVLTGYPFHEGNVMGWPVYGDIALKFSMDTTVFYKTLGQYKVSPAVVINAATGTDVKAASAGVIQQVIDTKETGITMTVDMGNGYQAIYGMLNEVSLKSGDMINTGDVIGTVGIPSAYYKEEGPGIYFEVLKDGTPVDPLLYFTQEE